MYEDLERLNALKEKGAITEEEYQKEKKRLLDDLNNTDKSTNSSSSSSKLWGLNEKSYCTLMHISQFAGVLVPVGGYVLPIVMWMMGKEDSAMVDKQGRAILNWMISLLIYLAISGVLCVIAIGIPLLIVLVVLNIVFVIKGAVKANEGEYWDYPMTIHFL